MDGIDTRSARLAMFFQKAQSHSIIASAMVRRRHVGNRSLQVIMGNEREMGHVVTCYTTKLGK